MDISKGLDCNLLLFHLLILCLHPTLNSNAVIFIYSKVFIFILIKFIPMYIYWVTRNTESCYVPDIFLGPGSNRGTGPSPCSLGGGRLWTSKQTYTTTAESGKCCEVKQNDGIGTTGGYCPILVWSSKAPYRRWLVNWAMSIIVGRLTGEWSIMTSVQMAQNSGPQFMTLKELSLPLSNNLLAITTVIAGKACLQPN